MSAERKRQYIEEFGDPQKFVCSSCQVLKRDHPIKYEFKFGNEMRSFITEVADLFEDYQSHRDLCKLNADVLDHFTSHHFSKPVFVFDYAKPNSPPTSVKAITIMVPFVGKIDIEVDSPLHISN
jgi:hypothetical protein